MTPFGRLALVIRLKRRPWRYTRRSLQRHQDRRLARQLRFIRSHSPYYRTIAPPAGTWSLDQVPAIDKPTMMAEFDRINTKGLESQKLMPYAIELETGQRLGLYQSRYSLGLSSGTSGSRGLTVLGKLERQRYGCLLAARNGISGRIPRKRVLFALRTNNPAFMAAGGGRITMYHADYTKPVAEIIAFINEKSINVLAGPPTLLVMIARNAQELQSPIQAVVSYAEVLEPQQRETVESAFGCPVSEIYQGSEGFLAFTCPSGNLHLNEDLIHFELTPPDPTTPETCRVTVTDLYRRVQPIIRYQLNDLIELHPDPCPCGSVLQRVKRIHGRADHTVLLRATDGGLRHLFPDYVRRSINQSSDAVLDYQAIQADLDSLELRVVLEDGADPRSVRSNILERLEVYARRLGCVLPRIEFSSTPPESHPVSGKMIRVLRTFDEPPS